MRPRTASLLVIVALASHLSAQTTHNDDSCDIGTYPAATLLLPYFEVDLSAAPKATTIFSVTNVSATPQIANVTIWTDWAFPVISFPIFLTGYDVQPINLYDVIARGLIGGPGGTSTGSPNARDSRGQSTNPNLATTPLTNLANPLFLTGVGSDCAPGQVPHAIPEAYAADVRALLSTGRSSGAAISCPARSEEAQLGWNHGGSVALGYVTIDVVATCSPLLHTDSRYWEQILFDNVLTGDYQQIGDGRSDNDAGGNPMVHIRAVPEGGPAGNTSATNLPYTFYDRYTTPAASRTFDRRQPLPSSFAARWISGRTIGFGTDYMMWREGVTGSNAACDQYHDNGLIGTAEIVRFDERENAGVMSGGIIAAQPFDAMLPATSRNPVENVMFPVVPGSTDAGGWMFLNMNNGGASRGAPYSASRVGYGAARGTRDVSQNWVIVSMHSSGRFSVESDATSLGNGCSPAAPFMSAARDESSPAKRIGPASNVNP